MCVSIALYKCHEKIKLVRKLQEYIYIFLSYIKNINTLVIYVFEYVYIYTYRHIYISKEYKYIHSHIHL